MLHSTQHVDCLVKGPAQCTLAPDRRYEMLAASDAGNRRQIIATTNAQSAKANLTRRTSGPKETYRASTTSATWRRPPVRASWTNISTVLRT